jgi:hypothetical protein
VVLAGPEGRQGGTVRGYKGYQHKSGSQDRYHPVPFCSPVEDTILLGVPPVPPEPPSETQSKLTGLSARLWWRHNPAMSLALAGGLNKETLAQLGQGSTTTAANQTT